MIRRRRTGSVTSETPSPHNHGPTPSYEWILEGEPAIVVSHLKEWGPVLRLNDRHFDIVAAPVDDRPTLYRIELEGGLAGGIDLLPLPAQRSLMRLYLCSDLGEACLMDGGDDVVRGFTAAWLSRLQALAFLSAPAPTSEDGRPRRPLGFHVPEPPPTPMQPAAGEPTIE